ncbi:SDR family oxidoreductase [Leuconostoc gelidum]|uniref:SDR family oxidoreductase n=1 Tax=Leuconostoc gelidum subsp. gelidum TaxID=1607839 RepID=A0ABS7V197_LEUGE|nr:SDR family NAD(P)-dependent oxidoreductase [Leuconostoc gelidum]AFS39679.1 3-oxoacyl-[acyl-carrier-protein] reductase [Leuconostoc gelidum JB7]MBZ5964807.1 SDR family oxidoreductase [Leuconostoc gelidum subsp. gelidum]MBZ5977428.1 SDR family oxidoreductase [Leuconostoc gelidum subsp. gelidum]MBZ5991845.1 SDR family oxidoreductase [Leuconostoc gelidum subsp. gelidum]MBZ5999139.1 SDR family oxidoreductase [Leuconostoc gelidum subsp. gelidum]
MDVNGKNILVTGSTKGIGLAIAKKLDSMGGHIILNGRNEPQNKIFSEFEKPVIFLKFDVDNFDECQLQLGKFLNEKNIDILVNNAGIVSDKLFSSMTRSDFIQVVDTNLHSMFNVTQLIYKNMIMKKQGGSILNMASVVAKMGHVGQTNYATSKAGVIGFTKTLSLEAARYNIRVNAIAPGMIHSDMTDKLSERNKQKIINDIPLKRFGRTSDVADAAALLITNSYITGQTLVIDGGMSV